MKSDLRNVNPTPVRPEGRVVPGRLFLPRWQRVIAVLGLVALSGGLARASSPVLFNGYLDQIGPITTQPDGLPGQVNPCPIGWNIDAVKTISGPFFDGGDSEPWCNVTPPSDPAGYGFFFKPFQGSTNANPSLDDLLSVHLFQDNAATPNTVFTFSADVACEANCCVLVPGTSARAYFVVEFLDNTSSVLSSNAYDLVSNGLPTSGPGSMGPLTTPQYTAPAGTVTVRAGVFLDGAFSTTGAQSFFADNLDLEATPPPGSPNITSQPGSTTVAPGGTAQFTIVASAATTYQWQHAGTNVSNSGEYSGANTATLKITGASVADVGHYRVLVSNAAGGVYSADAVLALMSLGINPVVSITGKAGDTYRTDYATQLAPTTWIPLSTNRLTSATLQVIDPVDARSGQRFYRSVFLY